jgi:hypothetical protein
MQENSSATLFGRLQVIACDSEFRRQTRNKDPRVRVDRSPVRRLCRLLRGLELRKRRPRHSTAPCKPGTTKQEWISPKKMAPAMDRRTRRIREGFHRHADIRSKMGDRNILKSVILNMFESGGIMLVVSIREAFKRKMRPSLAARSPFSPSPESIK